MHRASLLIALLALPALAGCLLPAESAPDEPQPTAPREAPVQDWSQLLGDPDGHRKAPDTIPHCRDCFVIEWQADGINPGPHTAAKGSAIVVDEVLYVGGDTGKLHAFDLDGNELWNATTRPSANGIHGTPAVLGDLVYIGAYEGSMYAYDRHNGSLVWEHDLGGSIGSSPRIHDGVLYIAVETPRPSGIMYALEPDTGDIIWEDHDLTNHPHSPAAVDTDNGIVLVGDNDGVVHAWDLDGQRLWRFHATADELVSIKGPMVVHDGVVYFASWDRNAYAVDSQTGEEIWRHRTDGKSMSGVALAPELGLLYVGSHDGFVRALHMDDGTEAWRFKTGWLVMGTPTVSNDTVIVGSRDRNLYGLDAQTGEELWRITAVGGVDSTPLIVGDRIAFTSRRSPDTETPGRLYMIGPKA